MKQLILLFTLLFGIYILGAAQSKKAKVQRSGNTFRDSMYPVKSPKQASDKYANQEVSYKAKTKKPVSKTKLDDLKNPFDTGKVKTNIKTKNYIGETEKN